MLEQDRGSLPFELVHGEAAVACAAWALAGSGVTVVDPGAGWAALGELREPGEPLVLHDALCPMTPPAFLAECRRAAVAGGVVVVGVRPVTDTVKRVVRGSVRAGPDRSGLLAVTSPVVLPAEVPTELLADMLGALGDLPSVHFGELVARLAERFPVRFLPAPASGRRVGSAADVRLLEALTGPG